jgi:hypothetical protein
VLYVLGAISILGLILNIKNHSKARLITIVALTISVVAVILGKETGTTGGEVRHTEIRTEGNSNTINDVENRTEDHD